jgi:hypothetical protein
LARERWLRIKVELLSGGGLVLESPPGRVMIVSPSHMLAELAEAIDLAFARWDHSHQHQFDLGDGRRYIPGGNEFDDEVRDSVTTPLGELGLVVGSSFEYVFDLGDDWRHHCEVQALDGDPFEEYGELPEVPLPTWGWGWIPDQYGRVSEVDDE